MPLIGPWEVYWSIRMRARSRSRWSRLTRSVCPQGVYRGFRHVGEGKGTLLTIIGGPDAGRVDWHPDVTSTQRRNPGWSRDEAGDLKVTA